MSFFLQLQKLRENNQISHSELRVDFDRGLNQIPGRYADYHNKYNITLNSGRKIEIITAKNQEVKIISINDFELLYEILNL